MAGKQSKSNALLDRFAKWFSSAAGVWQTLGAVLGWVCLEYGGVVHDSNMFQLMAWLTIYSAVTQPVLAYANRQDTSDADLILARIEQQETVELSKLDILLEICARQCPACGAVRDSTTLE